MAWILELSEFGRQRLEELEKKEELTHEEWVELDILAVVEEFGIEAGKDIIECAKRYYKVAQDFGTYDWKTVKDVMAKLLRGKYLVAKYVDDEVRWL